MVFENEFSETPQVFVAFSLLDLVSQSDYRVAAKVKNITKKEFTLVLSTWNDSLVWSVAISWFAFIPTANSV